MSKERTQKHLNYLNPRVSYAKAVESSWLIWLAQRTCPQIERPVVIFFASSIGIIYPLEGKCQGNYISYCVPSLRSRPGVRIAYCGKVENEKQRAQNHNAKFKTTHGYLPSQAQASRITRTFPEFAIALS